MPGSLLNEQQIFARLTDPDPARRIVVTPLFDVRQQFGPSSLDLRLGCDFLVFRTSGITHLDPLRPPAEIARDLACYTQAVEIGPGEAFVLHPGEFALASTLEYIVLPCDIAARLEGRSTWGRLGLEVHATAGFVDPGFAGALTFELYNAGKVPLSLFAGVRIGQLCFFELEQPSALPYREKTFSKYAQAVGTVGSKYYRDPEYEVLRQRSSAVGRQASEGERPGG